LVDSESARESRSGDIIERWGCASDINGTPLVEPVDKQHARIAGRASSISAKAANGAVRICSLAHDRSWHLDPTTPFGLTRSPLASGYEAVRHTGDFWRSKMYGAGRSRGNEIKKSWSTAIYITSRQQAAYSLLDPRSNAPTIAICWASHGCRSVRI
jgi:hypothetical protein